MTEINFGRAGKRRVAVRRAKATPTSLRSCSTSIPSRSAGAWSVTAEPLEDRRLLAATVISELDHTTRSSHPSPFAEINGVVLLDVDEGGLEQGGLWRTDGTASGTFRLAVNVANPSANSKLLGNQLLFQGPGQDLWKYDGGSQTVSLVKGMGAALLQDGWATSLNGRILFSGAPEGNSSALGLWQTDGTQAGTTLVSNIRASGISAPRNFARVGETVFFSADDGVHGRELWKTDGTAIGTVLVKDINPGGASSSLEQLVDVNGTLYFAANDGVNGMELWKSDGTQAGTVLVADLTGDTSSFSPQSLTPAGDAIYFTNSAQTQLFRAAANNPTPELLTSGGVLSSLTASGGSIFFADAAAGRQGLWRSGGATATTSRLADLTQVRALKLIDGVLFFQAEDGVSGRELWRSDGTAAGTTVLDLVAGPEGSYPSGFVTAGGLTYFQATDGVKGSELWVTDGTLAGSRLVKDINELAAEPSAGPPNEVLFREQIFFTSDNQQRILRTDGTQTGTTLFSDARAFPGASSGAFVQSMTPAGDKFYFVTGEPTGGYKLYVSDGSTDSIVYVATFSGISHIAPVGDGLYFTAGQSGSPSSALYKSDGTAAGTQLVKDKATGSNSFSPEALTPVGGTVYFFASDDDDRELWKTDGTAANTVRVKNIRPIGSSVAQNEADTATLDGIVYFVADDGVHGDELWRTDGTDAGTYLAYDSIAGSDSAMTGLHDLSTKDAIVAVPTGPAKGIYFIGYAAGAVSLYRYDGVTGAAVLTLPGSSSTAELALATLDSVYVTQTVTIGGTRRNLYRYDGSAGSGLVKSWTVGNSNDSRTIGPITQAANGRIYFTAPDDVDGAGRELYESDGTPGGTQRVTNIGNSSSAAYGFAIKAYAPAAMDAAIIFPSVDNTLREQLWRVDITPTRSPPASPTGLAASAVNGVQINLAWSDNADNEVGYRLQRSISPTFSTIDKTFHVLAGSTSLADRQLLENTTYYYRLVAYNSGGDSSVAATGSATTPNTPRSPTNLRAVATPGAQSGRQVELTWNDDATNETSYVLRRYRASDNALEMTVDLPADTTAYVDTGVQPLTSYVYRVLAVNGVGSSAQTADSSLTTPDVVPTTPTNLIAWGISDTSISLQWDDAATSETGYAIERASGGGTFVQIATRGAQTKAYVDNAVSNGVSYSYRVRATGAVGDSDYSQTATAAPLLPRLVSLIKDINATPTTLSSTPSKPVALNGVSYFAATDSIGGRELWRTDGTTAGTFRVIDLNVGTVPSNPTMLTVAGDGVYFFADGGVAGKGLWKTDGTAAGTLFVKAVQAVTAAPPVAVGSNLFFTVADSTYGTELWKSDGTAGGTIMVRDAQPGSGSSSPLNLTAAGTTLFFSAATGAYGRELWKCDGTADGTVMVKDIALNFSSDPSELTSLNSVLYFSASSANFGAELWRSDGTAAGTYMVKDVNPVDQQGSNPQSLVNFNGTLYFGTHPNGTALWKSDGTEAGTVLVKSLPTSSQESWQTKVVGNNLYFRLRVSGVNERRVYRSDGTDAGTTQLFSQSAASSLDELTVAGGRLYFTAANTLWTADATSTSASSLTTATTPTGLAALGDSLLFSSTTSVGTELHKSDGTPPTTGLLADIAQSTASASPSNLVQVGPITYFAATPSGSTPALFRSDGTAEGTFQIVAGNVTAISELGGTIYFATNDNSVPRLWKTTGEAGNATLVSDSLPNSSIGALYVAGTRLYFVPFVGGVGQLWSSDGTTTARVSDVNVLTYFSSRNVATPTALGSVLFFTASSPTAASGVELWRTDGTSSGTYAVADINPTGDSTPSELTAVGSTLYFVAYSPTYGSSLWKTDGTSATLVKDGFVGTAAAPGISRLKATGSGLYFAAAALGAPGQEPWRSDGTAAGTVQVADLSQTAVGSNPQDFTLVGSQVYFRADDDARGIGMYRTDGTPGGTFRVVDLVSNSLQNYFLDVNGTFYFANSGYLWTTDGTTTGTVRQMAIGNVQPPSATKVAVYGDELRFVAATTEYGTELFKLNTAAPTAPSAAAVAPGSAGGNLVTWTDNSLNETGFVIERLSQSSLRAASASGDGATVERTVYVDSGVTQFVDPFGSLTQYRIRAYNAAGASDGALTGESAPPTPPTIVSWSAVAAHGNGLGDVELEIPDSDAFVESRAAGVRKLIVRFDSAIDLASFTPSSVRLSGNDLTGSLVLSGINISTSVESGGLLGVITFSQALPDYAKYLIRLDGLTGVGGAALAGDADRVIATLTGDVSGDGRVNATDLSRVRAASTGLIDTSVINQVRADVTGDGRVNATDLSRVQARNGQDVRGIPTPS